MMALWVPAALITLVALGFLVTPFFVRRNETIEREAFDVTVYKDQLKEVDRDLTRGLLSEIEAEGARAEIQRRLLAAAPSEKGKPVVLTPTLNRIAAVVIALAVPLGAFAIYGGVGSPNVRDHPLSQRPALAQHQADVPDEEAKKEAERINQMVAELARRLEAEPDNLEGWGILARSYAAMGRFADAAGAYNQALRLSGRDPELLSAYGEVLILVQRDGTIPPIALTVFRETLEKNPTDPRAQFYLGLAEAQGGNLQGAFDIWLKLYEASPDGAPWLLEIGQRLQIAAKELGIEDRLPASVTNPPQQPPMVAQPGPVAPAAPGPTREQMEAAGDMSDADRDTMIRSMVKRLADRLKDNPNDRDGWLRLARAYEVLGETQKAEDAKSRAAALDK